MKEQKNKAFKSDRYESRFANSEETEEKEEKKKTSDHIATESNIKLSSTKQPSSQAAPLQNRNQNEPAAIIPVNNEANNENIAAHAENGISKIVDLENDENKACNSNSLQNYHVQAVADNKADKENQLPAANKVQSKKQTSEKLSLKENVLKNEPVLSGEQQLSEIKPVKLRFSDAGAPKPENKVEERKNLPPEHIEMQKPVIAKPEEKKNVGKRTMKKRNAAYLQENCYVKVDSEELVLTEEQKKIADLFQLHFKKPKGNREFFIRRDLAHLKDVKTIYKDVLVEEDRNTDDLDICPQYGEKVIEQENGTRVWRQIDIKAMKLEKRKTTVAALHEVKPKNGAISLELNGESHLIGERGLTKRPAIDSIDNGKVKVLFHGEHQDAHLFVLEVHKGGKFVHNVGNETVVLRIHHAGKGCSVSIGSKAVEGIESDMVVFVPKKTELVLQNNSKTATAVMRVEISMYGNS